MNHEYIKLAIIGRPNVGKSTLFNRLIRERKSIVDDTPGVTRDRLYSEIEWNGKTITLIDTGGLTDDKQELNGDITKEVKKQVISAIEEADFILFLVDGKAGITSEDEKITKMLRKFIDKKKIFLLVNKIDTEKQSNLVYEFYSLGLGEPYPVSALSGSSALADILDEAASSSRRKKINKSEIINVAIVGKPNVGKSSILNCLIGKERSIVTPVPGTTRDVIDTKVIVCGQEYNLIDTAGLRRKSKVATKIERYSTLRSISAIERADVVLLLIEAVSDISDQDQKIASLIKKRNKPSVIVANKWDLVENKSSNTLNRLEKEILTKLHFVDYSRILFTSAAHKKNVNKVWALITEVYKNYNQRISTGKLNKLIEEIVLLTSPPSKKGKSLKIYYSTQANIKPPEIVFFVNESSLVSKQYERFLERGIREKFDFSGTPIKLVFRNKRKQ